MKVNPSQDYLNINNLGLKPQNQSSITNQATKSFTETMKAAIDQVNTSQVQSNAMAEGYLQGTDQHSLDDVMVALQKANVSFQAMTQVRNRLVSAYQEIMNMQV